MVNKRKKEVAAFNLKISGIHVVDVAFDRERSLFAYSEEKCVRIWSIAEQKEVASLRNTDDIRCMAFDPTGVLLALGSDDNNIYVWSVVQQKKIATLKGHTDCLRMLAFDKKGKILASSDFSDSSLRMRIYPIRLWSMEKYKELTVFKGHRNDITSMAFDETSQLLASGSEDKTIRIWSITAKTCLTVLKGYYSSVESVVFSSQDLLASADSDGILVWQPIGDKTHWQLIWRNVIFPDLYIEKLRFEGAKVSTENRVLLSRGEGQEGQPQEESLVKVFGRMTMEYITADLRENTEKIKTRFVGSSEPVNKPSPKKILEFTFNYPNYDVLKSSHTSIQLFHRFFSVKGTLLNDTGNSIAEQLAWRDRQSMACINQGCYAFFTAFNRKNTLQTDKKVNVPPKRPAKPAPSLTTTTATTTTTITTTTTNISAFSYGSPVSQPGLRRSAAESQSQGQRNNLSTSSRDSSSTQSFDTGKKLS